MTRAPSETVDTVDTDDTDDTVALGEAGPNRENDGGRLGVGEHLDHYRILGLVAAGGMGQVYEALDLELDRRVALKVIHRGVSDPEGRRRFLREARAMAKLTHPHVVSIYEVGNARGIDFISMELVEGLDLSRWSQERQRWSKVVRVYLDAGQGLAAAHAKGLVHRDFKPSNVLMARDGRVLVTDFGLAKLAHDPEVPTSDEPPPDDERQRERLQTITAHGTVVGTPAFMAPELLQGAPATPGTDQYGFCAALFHSLTGRYPRGATVARVQRTVAARRAPLWPRGSAPRWLRRVIERGLSIEPEARFDSMARLLRKLERGLRRPMEIALASAVAVATAAGAWVAWSPQAEVSCGVLDPSLSQSWSPAALAAAEQVITAHSSASSPKPLSFVGERLDAYERALRESYREACERADRAPRHATVSCLDRRRERLRLVSESLRSPDAFEVERAMAAARMLPPIGVCEEGGSLYGETALPEDPAVQRAVDELRIELARIDALVDGRRLPEAIPRTARAVGDARALGYRPVLAEALTLQGETQRLARHFNEARQALGEAILVAEEAHHDALFTRALVVQAVLFVESSLDGDEITEGLRRADAALDRGAGTPELAARLEVYRALAERPGGPALDHLETAVRAYQRLPTGNRMLAIDFLLVLATQYTANSRYEDARQTLEESLALGVELVGTNHADVWLLRGLLADALRRLGEYDQSHQLLNAIAEQFADDDLRRQLELYMGENVRADAHTRAVTVRVLDAQGHPVPNAELVAASRLSIDGKYLYGGPSKWRRQERPVRAWTNAQGEATLEELSDDRSVMIAAEHDRLGRSVPVDLAPGQTPEMLALALSPWGSLRGTLTLPPTTAWATRYVMVAPREVTQPRRAHIDVKIIDGRYAVPRLPAGRHTLYFNLEERNGDLVAIRREVEISAGTTTEHSLDWSLPPPELDIELDVGNGPTPSRVFMFLAVGVQPIEHTSQIDELLPIALERGPMQIRAVTGTQPAQFLRLTSGLHTLCVDLAWDESFDPQRRSGPFRIDRGMVCRSVVVEPDAAPRRFVLDLDP